MDTTLQAPRKMSGEHKRITSLLQKESLFAWIWVAPALFFIIIFLVYPTLVTFGASFQNANSTEFIGLDNYLKVFTDKEMVEVLKNNVIWLVLATVGCVLLGLIIAVLVDRVRIERVIKTVIFILMAISFVGASVIWKFVYDYQPPDQGQIGLLNAIVTGTGNQPQGWLTTPPGDNLALIVIYVWMWTGFCMVILSAALKGIPLEILEAARCDGASEWHIFTRIIVPMISPTIVVVTTTMVINVLKIFDIIYTLTGGDFETNVVAMRFFQQMFIRHDFGRASALAMILLVIVIPVMIINVRRFRAQEARR